MPMAGLTINSLRGHVSLVPLFACIGGGACLAFGYLGRLATQCPDVTWNKRTNPIPWQRMKPTSQYKFYSPNLNYSELKHPVERPDI